MSKSDTKLWPVPPAKPKAPINKHVLIEVFGTGPNACLTVGDQGGCHRLAGPKPTGGLTHSFKININELRKQLDVYEEIWIDPEDTDPPPEPF
jgi:hypothetical protein